MALKPRFYNKMDAWDCKPPQLPAGGGGGPLDRLVLLVRGTARRPCTACICVTVGTFWTTPLPAVVHTIALTFRALPFATSAYKRTPYALAFRQRQARRYSDPAFTRAHYTAHVLRFLPRTLMPFATLLPARLGLTTFWWRRWHLPHASWLPRVLPLPRYPVPL